MSFNDLTEDLEDHGYVIATEYRSTPRLDIYNYGFTGKELGGIALKHGYIVRDISPENDLVEHDEIAVFFTKIDAHLETRTVEVEKEVTVFQTETGEVVLDE